MPLDRDMLIAEPHLRLHGVLDHIAPQTGRSSAYRALADIQRFLGQRDHLLGPGLVCGHARGTAADLSSSSRAAAVIGRRVVRCCGSQAVLRGTLLRVDWRVRIEDGHHALGLAFLHDHGQYRAAALDGAVVNGPVMSLGVLAE